ncbi:hypothetical protein HOLleu_36568 [Holothuria leucospilota]|uniref:RNA-directed DNA polymerase n=1 Tax=Holothuria leucospilota TaxID=206669 RepID=A0A9Q1BDS2_HOLLE|nr:hypothetical protein HOLleu_36568 [Holothuria leucospilota]
MARAMIGTLQQYNSDIETWTEYIERMEHFFDANEIAENEKRKAVLLSSVGPKTYKLMKTLLSPATPRDKTFTELVKLVKEHECPKPSPIVQRFKFNSRKQKEGETVAEYVADLRRIAEYCEYGDKLEEMLRDRIVCGVKDIRTQRRLLSETTLDFKKALETAKAMETAAKHSKDLQNVTQDMHLAQNQTVNKLSQAPRHKNQGVNNLKGRCYRCGSKEHKAHECKHIETVCYNCKTKGHLSSVCQKPKQHGNSRQGKQVNKGHRTNELGTNETQDEALESGALENVSVEYDLFTLTKKPIKPFTTQVKVEGKMITMEIDTGAAVTVMSKAEFDKHWPDGKLPLNGTNAFLRTYTGERVEVYGQCDVKVTGKDKEAILPLLVIPGEHSTLLGRNWLLKIPVDWGPLKQITAESVENVVERHSEVFAEGLGKIKGYKAKLYLKEEATPRYVKARSVPFSLKEGVEKELERLQEQNIISPVEFSEWATPIVPVVKTDGSIRICGDYKVTLNQCVKVDKYPLPHIEDLFAKLAGGKRFSKLDMSHAYQQVELDEGSKGFTTISTQKGLFVYNRLPFGISSSPGIFQRTMDNLTQGLPGVVTYLDDILVTGASEKEHAENLETLLTRLTEAGIRLRKDKCVFSVSEVIYLGYRIDSEGLHPIDDKAEAILKARQPTNVTELRSYLGLLNYYGRFLPSLSQVLAPLHQLLKKSVQWNWSANEQRAFQQSKQMLLSSNVLVHYDPSKPLIMSCDASPYGVGVVLSHQMEDGQERPIAFASRTLTTAEERYSQLDKEGLAIVFGVTKFHKYVYGRKFCIYTDHKPLLGLFGEGREIPKMASARIVRWALKLSAYNYELKYKSGSTHQNADALSRLPVKQVEGEVPIPGDVIMLLEYISNSPITARDIKTWTRRDPVLSKVYYFVQNGWDDECMDEELLPYFKRKLELSTQDGIIMWGSRVVVPPQGRKAVMKQLHEGHPGISRIKQVARSYVWWPKMDKELEQTVKDCQQCQLHRKLPAAAPLNPWPWTDKPWSRIHIDFAGPFHGKMILIVVDSHSKWVEAVPMDTSTAQATISKLRSIFATHGLPELVVTDNGRNFTSGEFGEFLKRNGVKHVFTAPYHPASNGLVERAVQTVKEGIRKMGEGTIETKIARFLFHYRNTPHTTTGQTPSELLMNRKVRTHMDALKPDLGERVRYRQALQKEQHDTTAKDRHFEIDDRVFVRDLVNRQWLPGVITDQSGPVSFTVQLDDNRIIRRHQDHLRHNTVPRTLENSVSDDTEIFVPSSPTVCLETPPTSETDTTEQSTSNITNSQAPELRRSKRVIKPPERLDL